MALVPCEYALDITPCDAISQYDGRSSLFERHLSLADLGQAWRYRWVEVPKHVGRISEA